MKEVFQGSGVTMLRNAFLFSSFVVYIDFSKQIVPGGLGPFLEGGVCASLAWMTIWPLDVVKSQMQSGNYKGQGIGSLLKGIIRDGLLFRGLLPGLLRSTIANGAGMVMYRKTEQYLNNQ